MIIEDVSFFFFFSVQVPESFVFSVYNSSELEFIKFFHSVCLIFVTSMMVDIAVILEAHSLCMAQANRFIGKLVWYRKLLPNCNHS